MWLGFWMRLRRNRVNRKLYRFLASVLLTMTIGSNFLVLAEPLSEELENKNKYIQSERNKLDNIRTEKEELEIKIQILDSSIVKILTDIEKNKIEKNTIQNDIKTMEKEIESLEKEVKNKEELFNLTARTLYVNGLSGYLEVLLAADGFQDLWARIEFIRTLNEYYSDLQLLIEDKKKGIEVNKDELENQASKLKELQVKNEEQLLSFNEKRDEQDSLLLEIKSYEDTLVSNIEETEQYVNEMISQLNNKTNDSESEIRISRGSNNLAVDELLSYSATFLGTPYLWGGTSPETGFDCSGFTQYVFARFGVTLGRTTYDQINDGIRVEKSELRPGDLVFFGTWGNPYHMGIYWGDDKFIHSPRTGDVLKISSMSRMDFLIGIRVF